MKFEDKLQIEVHGTMTASLSSAFHLLYEPLIGLESASLYQILIALHQTSAKIKNHHILKELTKLSMERLEKNRHILEKYLLLKTYYNPIKNAYIYEIFMPKHGSEFLRHEVFGRLYMKTFGKQVYEFQKINFADEVINKETYEEITLPFENVLKEDWEDMQENEFLQLRPKHMIQSENGITLHFNFDRFLSNLSPMILPNSERNENNLRIIAELATIHGIHEDDMKKVVAQSMDLKTNKLNLEKLKNKVRAMKTEFKESSDQQYAMPPIRFLQMKQHGIDVTMSDKRLIESLIYEYHMTPEVVNVLIEYVLNQTNQKLTKAYVEKIAGVWIRLAIDTYEKALSYIEEEQKPKQKSLKASEQKELPAWYHEQEQTDTEEDFDKVALMERMRKLRGE